jgi:phosphoglycolate phosphatase-like HAD superfamily hydrolase
MTDDDPARVLKEFRPEHSYFLGIDSDGCAFDSMEIKHKECFIPNTIKYWNLQPVSRYARETAEFVNLYSKWRGFNRFPALTMVFDLLSQREEVRKRGVQIPDAQPLRDWIARETKLGNIALRAAVRECNDPILANTLQWSEAVNRSIADIVNGIPPFPFVRECLDRARVRADIIVVSATPTEALQREWREHDLARYARVIAGQEMGTKEEHLALAAKGKYAADHVLMIGDAPGDLQAAKANNALFYPIMPGDEERSWQRLFEEGIERFLAGAYAGSHEQALLSEFETHLPDKPPWRT